MCIGKDGELFQGDINSEGEKLCMTPGESDYMEFEV